MQKIKLIWDFNGVDSLKTAKHFNIHLEEFLTLLDKTKVAELVDALDLGSSS